MVVFAIKNPVFELRITLKSRFFKKFYAAYVIYVHINIELMDVDNFSGVANEFQQCSLTVSLVTVSFSYDDSNFRPFMLWVEIEQVYHAYKYFPFIGNNKSDLLVGVNVASGVGNELVQQKTRIWGVDISDVPCVAIVFYCIHHVKILRLHRP